MRDAQHLPARAELAQHRPDRRRDGAADADVDLVEDQRRHLADFGEHDLDREREARQLAAGRDARDRAQRLLRMGRDLNSTVSRP